MRFHWISPPLRWQSYSFWGFRKELAFKNWVKLLSREEFPGLNIWGRSRRQWQPTPVLFQGSGGKSTDPSLPGQLSTPMGSPHLTTVHQPLSPSHVIEELHRALATKHRQDSFQSRDSKGSPKKRVDVRLSRTCSVEWGKEWEGRPGASTGPLTVSGLWPRSPRIIRRTWSWILNSRTTCSCIRTKRPWTTPSSLGRCWGNARRSS